MIAVGLNRQKLIDNLHTWRSLALQFSTPAPQLLPRPSCPRCNSDDTTTHYTSCHCNGCGHNFTIGDIAQ